MLKMVSKSTRRKVLSTCMTVILLLSSTAAVSAVDVTDSDSPVSSVLLQEQSEQYEQLTIVGEQEDLRGEYEKHFLMSDGTVLAVAYETPVHYRDEATDTWREIDNTLSTANTDWLQMFFERVMRGDTVQQAVDAINQSHSYDEDLAGCSCGKDCGFYDAVVVGNGNFQLFATQ